LLGDARGVGRTGAAGEHRTDIAEDRGAQLVGKLFEILGNARTEVLARG
jgi:hypothetical protein